MFFISKYFKEDIWNEKLTEKFFVDSEGTNLPDCIEQFIKSRNLILRLPLYEAAEAAGDEGGPGGAGITKYIAPRALLWFRWAAIATWVSGALYLLEKKAFIAAFTLGTVPGESTAYYGLLIGVGAWMGTIMLFNVWILIWPNQKKVLGIVESSADEINRAKRIAFLASRTNTMLSVPMLMSMVGAHHGYFM